VLRAVGPQTVAALATVAIGLAVQHLFLDGYSQLARFAFSVPICVVVYLIISVGVFKVTGPLRLALSLLRDFSSIMFRRSPQLKQEASP
jgi:PST family polysaccharide transporter